MSRGQSGVVESVLEMMCVQEQDSGRSRDLGQHNMERLKLPGVTSRQE